MTTTWVCPQCGFTQRTIDSMTNVRHECDGHIVHLMPIRPPKHPTGPNPGKLNGEHWSQALYPIVFAVIGALIGLAVALSL